MAHEKQAHVLLPGLSEAEALAFVQQSPGFDSAFLLALLRQLPGRHDAEAYAAVWQRHGLFNRMVLSRRLPADAASSLRDLWERLRGKRRLLARMAYTPVPPSRAEQHQQQLLRLTSEKEVLEKELAAASPVFRRQQQALACGFADLARRLGPRTAVLHLTEVAHCALPPGGKGLFQCVPHYEAFVLRKTAEQPGYRVTWIPLGVVEPIDRAVHDWRAILQKRGRATVKGRSPDARLRELVWEKVESHLGGCTAILIIPDGKLTGVPWAALPGRRRGSYLLEDCALATAVDGYQLTELLGRKPLEEGPLLLVGGVSFGSRPAETLAPAVLTHRGPALEGRWPSWRELPGMAAEVEAIGRLRPGGLAVELLTGASAGKARLIRELPRSRYVHLATHGFFAEPQYLSLLQLDPQRPGGAQIGSASPGSSTAVAGRNPLLLSGVVLAGANLPPPIGPAGILTAEEIAQLGLDRTRLVVLSACETGLGDVAGGEGVLGLQRAFGLAGARTTIASLWKVDDRATQRLMTLFYENLWRKKLGAAEALRQAQLALLRDPTGASADGRGFEVAEEESGRGGRTDPRLWAAWTLSGDPGDLSTVVPLRLDEEAGGPQSEPAAPVWLAQPWLLVPVGALFGIVLVLALRGGRRPPAPRQTA